MVTNKQNVKSRHVGFMVMGLFFVGLAVGLAIDLLQDFVSPARTQPTQLQKRELALWGDLELERAVQALKDCILRGESIYSEDFTRHMGEVDRIALKYRSWGALDQKEGEALRKLEEALPKYQTAIYEVRRMRAAEVPVTQIDMAVKGQDRPVSAAFRELEAAVSDPNAFGRHLFRGAAVVFLCAALAVTLLYFSFALPLHRSAISGGDDRSLRELSSRIVRWEEDKESKAFSALHDRVCQSLTAVMYLLKGAEHADRANASFRSNVEPIIPSLQVAIRETLAIALDLRPPRLQESGLLGTLESVWADCVARRPGFEIVPRIRLKEEDVAEELKPVILRIARMAFDWAVQKSERGQLIWHLEREQNQIRLSVQVLCEDGAARVKASAGTSGAAPSDLAEVIRARIVMSGGTSDGVYDIHEGQAMCAIWPLPGGSV